MAFSCSEDCPLMIPCSAVSGACSPINNISYFHRTNISYSIITLIIINSTCQSSQTIRSGFNHSYRITMIIRTNHLIRRITTVRFIMCYTVPIISAILHFILVCPINITLNAPAYRHILIRLKFFHNCSWCSPSLLHIQYTSNQSAFLNHSLTKRVHCL